MYNNTQSWGLLLWECCHTLFNGLNELTRYLEEDTHAALSTVFDLFFMEDPCADMHGLHATMV